MKKIVVLLVIIGLIGSLAACGGKEEVTNPFERETISLTLTVTTGALTNEAQTSWTGGTRTEVTKSFKTNPAVVAIFSYDALDMLDYVGLENTSIIELGIPKSNVPGYLSKYNTNDVQNVGTLFMPDWDALELFMPDLIIIGRRSAGSYDQLSQQYPYADILDLTIDESKYLESMERNASYLAQIFPSVATEMTEKMDMIKDDITAIKNVAKDHEALFIMVNGEALSFYGPNGRFAVLYHEFGFIPSDPAAEEGGSHGNVIGYEYVASVNPEILFLLDRGVATGGSSTIDQVKNNALIKGTQAGTNNMIFTLDPIAWYISVGGFTSTEQMISDLEVVMNAL